jgi:hypothetical protein
MINRLSLWTMINVALSDSALLDVVDSVANALAAGDLTAVSDMDMIEGLRITPSGAAQIKPVLPMAAA